MYLIFNLGKIKVKIGPKFHNCFMIVQIWKIKFFDVPNNVDSIGTVF